MQQRQKWWRLKDEVRILTIRMPEEKIEELKQEALKRKVSLNKLINDVIDEWLAYGA